MIYNNYYNRNQYNQSMQMNVPCYFGCPLMQNYYRSYQPFYGNFYRTADGESNLNNQCDERYPNNPNLPMSQQHVNMVASMLKKDSMNILSGIQKFITDSRLFDYLLIALIAYICSYYNKNKDTIEEKTDELVEELRKNLPWVFDILATFGITPAMVDDFIDNLIRLTVMNIRKIMLAGL